MAVKRMEGYEVWVVACRNSCISCQAMPLIKPRGGCVLSFRRWTTACVALGQGPFSAPCAATCTRKFPPFCFIRETSTGQTRSSARIPHRETFSLFRFRDHSPFTSSDNKYISFLLFFHFGISIL